jgi:hypothetical protein
LLVDNRIDCHLHVDTIKRCRRNGGTIGPIIVELDAVWYVDLTILIILTWIIISFN